MLQPAEPVEVDDEQDGSDHPGERIAKYDSFDRWIEGHGYQNPYDSEDADAHAGDNHGNPGIPYAA